MTDNEAPYTLQPIGVVRSEFVERAQAPRQSSVASEANAEIVLHPGMGLEDAVRDLERWSHLWVISWFHENEGQWRPTVLPPRSSTRRGVFATRAPRRPNPIGLSATELKGVDGLVLQVKGLDLLDGTPVLDIKPYVPYADALPQANSGWLEMESPEFTLPVDPLPDFEVHFAARAEEQLLFLEAEGELTLRRELKQRLGVAPRPHAYRRIKPVGEGFRIAVESWRAFFRIDGARVEIHDIQSGYRAKELRATSAPDLHRRFAGKWTEHLRIQN
jgi:tRNA-Thr(GGU) m(6)t(6)A37 methyltransferase TsaA